MIAFLLNRLLQAFIVMMAVGLIAFSLFRFVGDPVNMIAGDQDSAQYRAELRERLGLNDPTIVQFARYIGDVAQGDFGISYSNREPVADLLLERVPATLELVVMSAVMALAIGIPMGIFVSIFPQSIVSRLFQLTSLIGISVPAFLIGILLILVFSVTLNWLPSFGRGETVSIGWWSTGLLTVSGLKSLIMPAITLGLFQMTLVMRLVRAEMMETLRTDFIKFARARGLPNLRIYFRHALKNTWIPVITVTGIQLGSLIAFAVITETVFQWPGMGFLFIQAVSNVDIPVMSAYLMLVGAFFGLVNLVVDLLYFVVDPRIRAQGLSRGAR